MDDDIDIEEHDILEHPQVKAAFPHLSKIEIQVHALGASFLDESSREEFENLLQERRGFKDIEDDGVSTDAAHDFIEDSPEGRLENGDEFNKEDNNDVHFISDSESNADSAEVVQAINGVVSESTNELVDAVKQKEKFVDGAKKLDLVDTLADKAKIKISNEKNAHETRVISASQAINDIGKRITDVFEISDDESEQSDKIDEVAPKIDGISEETPVETYCEDAGNLEFIDEDPKLYNIIEEGPTLDEIDEHIDGTAIDDVREEGTIASVIVEEGPRIDIQGTISKVDEAKENANTVDESLENNSSDDKTCSENDKQEHTKEQIHTETSAQYENVHIKKELDYEEDFSNNSIDTCDDKLPPEDIFHFRNMIILGSRPSPKPSLDTPCKLSLVPVVLLEDWSVHLNDSNSYCRECETLFVTPNALDSHRMVAHSLLAPINPIPNSTQANIARKSTSNKIVSLSSSTYCNHCNVTFKDNTSLIKHLYELLPGAQYNCSVCEQTFTTQSDLVKHNIIHVKREPRKILKPKKVQGNPILRNLLNRDNRTPKAVKRSFPKVVKPAPPLVNIKLEPGLNENEKFKCTICNAVLDTYGIARKHKNKHHSDYKRQDIFLKFNAETAQTERYKCTLCNVVLYTYGSARIHRNKQHSEYKGQGILVKLNAETSPSKTLAYEEDVCVNKKVKTDHRESRATVRNIARELVPKAALFQCQRCKLHFMTSAGASLHLIRNESCFLKPNLLWSCQICKKKLLKRDANRHKVQHKLSTNIKIYKVTRNTKERTLCKCTKCRVYFDYNNLLLHYDKCGKLPTAKCLKCNILMSKISFLKHEKKHNNEKLKQNDFIFIEYASINDKTKLNDKPKAKQVGKKIKVETGLKPKIVNKLTFEQAKHKIYYCKYCKCYLFGRSKLSMRTHLTKSCLKNYLTKCYNCNKCGLKVSRSSQEFHERMHSDGKFSLEDVEFLDFVTAKRITPPIPLYPCCKKCKIHFLNKKLLRKHICGEDYENCTVCGKMYENSLLDIHMSFHEVAAPKLLKSAPPSPKILPELMMKYESLNAIWNILFSCGKCEMISDVYNRAVEHSQSHLNKEVLPKPIKCYVCNLKFDESSWSKHSALHSRMKLDSKSFKILKYEPEKLLDESWFQMFESLPEKEIRQILDRSVFGSERSLKMELVKDGLPEFTIYCCSVCRVAYDNASILSHVHAKCKKSSHLCATCEIAFHDANALQFHRLLHKKGIKKEEFRIIQFVKVVKDPKPKLKKIKPPIEPAKVSTSVIVKLNKKNIKGHDGKKSLYFVLYECQKCFVCVHNKANKIKHSCLSPKNHWYCDICKVNFNIRLKRCHTKLHENGSDIRAQTIKIVCFGEPNESKSKEKMNYRRIPKHIARETKKNITPYNAENSSDGTETPKPRKTMNSSKSSMSISHESGPEQQKRTAKLFKCDCGLHFTSSRSIDAHIKRCSDDNDISKEDCSKCGLLFPTDVLVSHLCKHHSQKTEIIVVEEVHKKKQDKNHIKLYKCSDCNVFFLNQNSCYKHVTKHETLDAKEYIECKMCCLQFRILSLHVHMKKHHETNFDLDRVLVEEYHPSVGKQAPKIDIYFASDRFVSSSNGND